MNKNNIPEPIDISGITLSSDLMLLAGIMAEHSHEKWATDKMAAGYSYGENTDSNALTHALLVPYNELSAREKEYDINPSIDTLKTLIAMGYVIRRKAQDD